MKNEVLNMDCMKFMKDIPDNYYELAIVDPVYLDGFSVGTWTNKGLAKQKDYIKKAKSLETKTTKEYFEELFRISNNQIIWGGNYFALPISRGWIVWNKVNGVDNYFSDCELAWTSFDRILKLFTFKWQGMLQGDMKNKEIRIHLTQKPVVLYKWLLNNYAKEGDKIFDSHVGSGSSRIAAYELGFHFEGCELDKDYYEDQELRFFEFKKKFHNEFYIPDSENLLFKGL